MGQDQARLLSEVTSYDDDPKTAASSSSSSSSSSWLDQMYLNVPPGGGAGSAAPRLAHVTAILAVLRKDNFPPGLHKICAPGAHHWAAGEHDVAHPAQATSLLTVDEASNRITLQVVREDTGTRQARSAVRTRLLRVALWPQARKPMVGRDSRIGVVKQWRRLFRWRRWR